MIIRRFATLHKDFPEHDACEHPGLPRYNTEVSRGAAVMLFMLRLTIYRGSLGGVCGPGIF